MSRVLVEGAMSGRTVFTPNGDIVSSNAEKFKEEVLSAFGEGEVVVDLKLVNMIDSNGIGALLSINATLRKQGRMLKLINVSEQIMKMFKIMRFDQHFEIIPRL